jgi:hypothetical protein
MKKQKWKVSIAIHGIVANYEATIAADSEIDAEEKVRQMYEDGDQTNGDITDPDFTNAFLSNDGIDLYIEEADEDED